ncbi:peroxiredoxin (alkyl hydroperoxide reductase subunit C) [Exophiala aquamarina CBS 119918]|uniref:Peroxiredoxin (Alkyl hydroperoxide reductase subunit C) n=1 Tax=Exophiala aquamarina CBS 119918 TaxID=1182545 RepID=A0A072PT08_9EURO|nr:peroxiredoxin (alkyl hydroperoxide reductase subunit C) [Exophiala aquamarina CBS 119918]KEF62867.1 peroxiredoxin (alkyl hydroperoxide reductase subunit C) [Exophiala aquamarina CBS 119918]
MVKQGDSIPSVDLFENSPGNKVNLANELASGKGVIIGVPAAFSPGCSDSHIPGYLTSDKLKDAGKVFVVSVNDAFVMKAWGKSLDADKSSGIRFLADPTGEFSKAWDVTFDATPILGNHRSKRYATTIENGRVVKAAVEPDNTGISSELPRF